MRRGAIKRTGAATRPLAMVAALMLALLLPPQLPAQSPALDYSPQLPVVTDHLDHLRRPLVVEGSPCEVIWIYAEAPDYTLVGDEDEGIACVDDAARAARLYLELYEQETRVEYLESAANLLRFLVVMQGEDGRWYNFVWADGSINRSHVNSVASVGWWAARAFRAVARGLADLPGEYEGLRDSLRTTGRRGLQAAQALREPALRDSLIGYDVAAIWTLGLIEWERASGDSSGRPLGRNLAQWIADSRIEAAGSFPHAVLPAWRGVWHQYGMVMAAGLARAGRAWERQEWIELARKDGEGFQRWLIARGPLSHFHYAEGDTAQLHRFPQIAYGVHSLVECQLALEAVTGEASFALGAGLAASWLAGNNVMDTAMLDLATGRGYDGINAPGTVNFNSGAESTIEALFALASIRSHPEAARIWSARAQHLGPDQVRYDLTNQTVVLEREGSHWQYRHELK